MARFAELAATDAVADEAHGVIAGVAPPRWPAGLQLPFAVTGSSSTLTSLALFDWHAGACKGNCRSTTHDDNWLRCRRLPSPMLTTIAISCAITDLWLMRTCPLRAPLFGRNIRIIAAAGSKNTVSSIR